MQKFDQQLQTCSSANSRMEKALFFKYWKVQLGWCPSQALDFIYYPCRHYRAGSSKSVLHNIRLRLPKRNSWVSHPRNWNWLVFFITLHTKEKITINNFVKIIYQSNWNGIVPNPIAFNSKWIQKPSKAFILDSFTWNFHPIKFCATFGLTVYFFVP